MKESKGIWYGFFQMICTVSVAYLIMKLIDRIIIPFLNTIETIELREKLGFLILCIEIVLAVAAIASIMRIIGNVYKKIDTLRYNSPNEFEVKEHNKRQEGYTSLNDIISQKEKSIIQQYYKENLKSRNKGKLAAAITEHMCVLKYVDNIEPGYEKIEYFLKNDLELDAPGFQQIAASHDNLRNALKSRQKYLNKESQEPTDKEESLCADYDNYVKYYNDKLSDNEKN